MTMKPDEDALIDINTANMNWMPSTKNDSPTDTGYRKLYQAEMLCKTLCGESGEAFRTLNDVIQDGAMWLLSDLLTEAREAREACEALASAQESQH
jgi:hypothetical protein